MSPFILDNDTVTLRPVARSGKIRLGDIIAVADPDDGRIIIHRVIRKKKGYIQTKGDNNRTPDVWFPSERVIGVVEHIDTKRWTPYRSFRWQNILIALLSRTGLSNRVISPAATALWNFIR